MSEQARGNGERSPWQMWSELASGLMSAGTAFAPDASPPEAFRQIRSAWLGAWADFWEQFARSPQFQEMLRQSFSGGLQYRKQLNDYLADMQHQFQGVSRKDIDQLMLSVQHIEERMVDEIERLCPRLEDVGSRVDRLRRRVDELSNRMDSLREG